MDDAALDRLAARRWRVAVLLTGVMFVVYFGFVLAVAFARDMVSTLVGDTVSVGILLGAGTIVVAPILTAIYVRWANRNLDRAGLTK